MRIIYVLPVLKLSFLEMFQTGGLCLTFVMCIVMRSMLTSHGCLWKYIYFMWYHFLP